MTCGLQKGQRAVSSAFGGGKGRLSVPGSSWARRPTAILQLRPETGFIRTSMRLSTSSPEGATNLAVIISFSKDKEWSLICSLPRNVRERSRFRGA
jgi:hypothetical protein